jgi:hypothetical protein
MKTEVSAKVCNLISEAQNLFGWRLRLNSYTSSWSNKKSNNKPIQINR